MDFVERPQKPRRFPWWTLPVIAVCVGLLGYAYTLASGVLSAYAPFNRMRAAVVGDVFLGPVSLDGIPLTGLTMEEARAALETVQRARQDAFGVTVSHEAARWSIGAKDVPVRWDTQDQLDALFQAGKTGSLEQRDRELAEMEPLALTSHFVYDQGAVRRITESIAAGLSYDAVDATVVSFDADTRMFAFSQEVAGRRADAEALYADVVTRLDAAQYGVVVPVAVGVVFPAVTRDQLAAEYRQVAAYTTRTTDDDDRNTNIDLAARAVSGTRIEAGAEFSFNQTTGQRTREKGYREAGAIENGRTVEEVGGGVCQVSTTVFNALVRANCEIVRRKPHAWPSDYVPRGEDATVDWPNLDVVLRNTSAAPMFLVAYYADRRLTVEVYALSLGEGVTIELESETTYTRTPEEIVYTYDETLPVGTNKKVKNAHTGYSVTTYKRWLTNGEETSREKFYTSEYGMINEEHAYNDGLGPPVETPMP